MGLSGRVQARVDHMGRVELAEAEVAALVRTKTLHVGLISGGRLGRRGRCPASPLQAPSPSSTPTDLARTTPKVIDEAAPQPDVGAERRAGRSTCPADGRCCARCPSHPSRSAAWRRPSSPARARAGRQGERRQGARRRRAAWVSVGYSCSPLSRSVLFLKNAGIPLLVVVLINNKQFPRNLLIKNLIIDPSTYHLSPHKHTDDSL